jgi:hypothetical protein
MNETESEWLEGGEREREREKRGRGRGGGGWGISCCHFDGLSYILRLDQPMGTFVFLNALG